MTIPPPLPKPLWKAAIDAWVAAGRPRQKTDIPFRWRGHPHPLIVRVTETLLCIRYADSPGLLDHRRIPRS